MAKPGLLRIIPEQRQESPKWTTYAVIFSALPLLVCLVLFFFFSSQASSLKTKRADLQASILALESDVKNKEAENEVSQTAKRLDDFAVVLSSHKLPSQFFDLVRRICHPKVQFLNVDMSVASRHAALAGMADDFQALGEQLLALSQDPDIQNPEVSGIALTKEGKVNFDLTFDFSPEVLTKQQTQ